MATLIKRVQGFVRGQSSAGANGLRLIQDCVDHMYEHNDWTPLAWLINRSEAQDKSRIRAIVGVVAGGLTLSTGGKQAKVQPSGMFIKMAENAGPTDMMPTLRKLVEEGQSFRSKAVSEELLKKEPPKADINKFAKSIVNKMAKEGWTLKDVLEAIPNEIEPAKVVDDEPEMQKAA